MNNKPTTEKKSPLSNPPLRQAGQGLVEKRDQVFDDKMAPYIWMTGLFFIMAGYEWIRYFIKSPPYPWLFTIIAAGAVVWTYRNFKKVRHEIRNLNLAIKGEKLAHRLISWVDALGGCGRGSHEPRRPHPAL